MKKLQLNDAQAQDFIKVLKNVLKDHVNDLSENEKGEFMLESKEGGVQRLFQLNYIYATDNSHINLMDAKTKLTLVRINLDSRFHNNSDGKVWGHRVEIFSEDEFYKKNDSFTHIKAHSLPFDGIQDTDDFLIALKELLNYTNTHKQNRITITIKSHLAL
ncbi:DUF6978 family protein [Secundilactobacillus paracollinoides]|uniref:Uncharacterized protein n=1 Tax=Secundilactobacillus paracollinoides TaxID=240427 RepID=A0A1B2IVB8_9LACO|nr:hypothetical protein [Secundilactobacillus paracollinoides]ANZ60201.1 hypothetical protein AYR61_01770 [Secundilactobacillus paracollinoides]ANZ65995.1 hypothetical protein AYR63_01790 [Secundilactobacillus paracollinoides]KRL79878.1 hypothetical protein FC17_GL000184 [Secundilactobacillus paracollinoides DSM 15502 = JCM 11969]